MTAPDATHRPRKFGLTLPLPMRGQRSVDQNVLEERRQNELAALMALRLDAATYGADPALLGAIEVAEEALRQEPPALILATAIRRAVASRVPSPSSVGKVFLGVMISLLYAGSVAFYVIYGQFKDDTVLMGSSVRLLAWIGLIGATGGIMSMLFRIRDFAYLSSADTTIQTLSGVVRPLLGAIFAVFIYFVLESGIFGLGVVVPLEKREPFYAVLAFLAGFSERLAPSLALKAEETLTYRGQVPAVVAEKRLRTRADDGQAPSATP